MRLIRLAVSLILSRTFALIAAEAQQPSKIYRIGALDFVPVTSNAANLSALRQGLKEFGYVAGRNLIIEYRSADGQAERFPSLAAELVRLKVDVIVTRGTPAALAAKHATGTVPIVMTASANPVDLPAISREREFVEAGGLLGLTIPQTLLPRADQVIQ